MSELELRQEGDRTLVRWSGADAGYWEIDDRGTANVAWSGAVPRSGCRAALEHLRAIGVTAVKGRAPLLRYEARALGFGGALRAPLVWGRDWPDSLVEQMEALLPDTRVRFLEQSRLRAAWAKAVHGMADMTRIEVGLPDGRRPIRVSLPNRADLDAEAIAGAVDITLAVHARFGRAADNVRSILFDHSSHGLATGGNAGEAARHRGEFHLNASMVLASGNEEMSAVRAERREAQPERPQSAAVPGPWLQLDGTVAHELWHKIEMAWDTENYAETVEFRRAVGELVGCETIEKAIADPEARARLASGVSGYATTNRLEATAEMFKLWWCGPPPAGSIPEQFGQIVDRFFPVNA